MKQKILEELGYLFEYTPSVQERFQDVLRVRFDKESEIIRQFKDFFSSKEKIVELLEDTSFTEELKRLNLMNLQDRLSFIDEKKMPETVVISYMKLLVKEVDRPALYLPSAELEQAEEKMLNHLLDETPLNEELTELEGISNVNFRLVLQTWILYPDFLKHPDNLAELIECLSITNVRL